ncbi:NADPH-dependent FMN reductase [Chondrinema litorale]|uniref:NADPH-dependent FMN reductase n=1 Tax=Chondrinema litorale TaxID=2994555 RepID=UPI002542C8BE|nr:NAD(P)H-dependent oxidoreductase [Chondrinema litorale]UZR97988.1 NAD(P)H-dependent oxidoreductase [Chondrinema litorale]
MDFTVTIFYGSIRTNRAGIRAAYYIQNKLKERQVRVNFIDPQEYPLPFLDKMFKEYEAGTAPETMQKIADLLVASDGFIIVTGEYNHSIPPVLKNLLDHYQSEYFYKPSAIVSYSAGAFGGVRAAVHLRAILAELGMPSIPTTLPIPKVSVNFNENGITDNQSILLKTKKFLDEFEWYLEALKTQRLKHDKS